MNRLSIIADSKVLLTLDMLLGRGQYEPLAAQATLPTEAFAQINTLATHAWQLTEEAKQALQLKCVKAPLLHACLAFTDGSSSGIAAGSPVWVPEYLVKHGPVPGWHPSSDSSLSPAVPDAIAATETPPKPEDATNTAPSLPAGMGSVEGSEYGSG
ncbi:hypothetical protein AAY473_017117 [Plecturocebus cupreus]